MFDDKGYFIVQSDNYDIPNVQSLLSQTLGDTCFDEKWDIPTLVENDVPGPVASGFMSGLTFYLYTEYACFAKVGGIKQSLIYGYFEAASRSFFVLSCGFAAKIFTLFLSPRKYYFRTEFERSFVKFGARICIRK